jgi:hypothetical protein
VEAERRRELEELLIVQRSIEMTRPFLTPLPFGLFFFVPEKCFNAWIDLPKMKIMKIE